MSRNKVNEPPFPHVPPALLRKLQELFPPRDPQKGEPYEELMFYGGQRRVISFLEGKAEEQNNNILS